MIQSLVYLQDTIFKLLPMREDYDSGIDNHLGDYLEYVCVNFRGFMLRFPRLVDVHLGLTCIMNDLTFLRSHKDSIDEVKFSTWRKIVLHATNELKYIIDCTKGEGGEPRGH